MVSFYPSPEPIVHVIPECLTVVLQSGAVECAKEKLQNLSFIPGEVDTFVANF